MQLSSRELKAAANLLRQAQAACERVLDLCFDRRDVEASVRLSEIAMRLHDERVLLDGLVASVLAASGGNAKAGKRYQQTLSH